MGYLKRYLVLGGFGLLLMRYTSRMNLNKLREMTPAERRALLRERRETLERMTPAERRALREKLRTE